MTAPRSCTDVWHVEVGHWVEAGDTHGGSAPLSGDPRKWQPGQRLRRCCVLSASQKKVVNSSLLLGLTVGGWSEAQAARPLVRASRRTMRSRTPMHGVRSARERRACSRSAVHDHIFISHHELRNTRMSRTTNPSWRLFRKWTKPSAPGSRGSNRFRKQEGERARLLAFEGLETRTLLSITASVKGSVASFVSSSSSDKLYLATSSSGLLEWHDQTVRLLHEPGRCSRLNFEFDPRHHDQHPDCKQRRRSSGGVFLEGISTYGHSLTLQAASFGSPTSSWRSSRRSTPKAVISQPPVSRTSLSEPSLGLA